MTLEESTLRKTKKNYKRYKLFLDGREDVNDDIRLGRSTTPTTVENVEAAMEIELDSCRITIREDVEDVDIT